MSNKGAIRKISTTKDASNSSSRIRSKNSSTDQDDEHIEKSDSKKSQKSEHKGDGDRHSRLTTSSSSSRTQLSRTSTRQPSKPSQIKPNREPGSSSTSRSSASNSNVTGKPIASSRIRTDTSRKTSSSNVVKSKSKEKVQAGHSEKRGLSTIYIPQSTTNKLRAKPADKPSSTVKEKIQSKNSSPSLSSKTLPRERKLSRTLSPSEVKMLHSATARSGSMQKTVQKKSEAGNVQGGTEDEYDYEDDFEDYESDFQECTDSDASEISEESSSSQLSLQENPIELRSQEQRKTVHSAEQRAEEEHMLDSGHYELAEARRRAAMVESINADQSKSPPALELRQPTNKAYSEDRSSENKSLPISTDEGFEDSRSGDFTRTPPLSQISIIDFRKIKDNQVTKNVTQKLKKVLTRGEELLEMIKLDTMEWSLLECSPIPYEEFIRCYGKLNTQQMSTQTGEDNIDIDTQTDKVTLKNKWTQFPVTCRRNLDTKEDLDLFRMENVGVGGDDTEIVNATSISFDILRLNHFLSRAGRVMLSLLEERKLGGNIFQNERQQLPFSDGVVKLSVNSVTFLSGRAVTIMHYSEVFNKVLLTIHSSVEEEIETLSKQDYITDCCIGCVWNISEPSMPIKLFYSPCTMTACCFHSTNYNVVFAGLQDGSISLWDLKEDEMWHQKVTDKANELDWTIRTPTYTTAANTDIPTHNSQIVAIRVLSKIENKSFEIRKDRFVPIQICSFDDEGVLIVWSVLHNMGLNIDDLGLSFWGDIRLIKNQRINLISNKEKKKTNVTAFVDMHVDRVDANNIYAATNTSSIMHATCIGNKTNPVQYEKIDIYPSANVTCIEVCPFEHSFFLAGCDDGTIRLHSLNIGKPILQLKDENCATKIKVVQWSKSRPFTVYVLDTHSRIHVWDLGNSDIHSSRTVDMKMWGSISTMQLSSCKTDRDMAHQYLAIGTESGNVEVHKLKTDFSYSKREECLRELNTFMRYVAIL